ncbi:MAG: PEP-CTERM sorting domain-containing protein [Bryobacteraceae bacterium]
MKGSVPIMAALVLASAANAGIITYSGFDAGANGRPIPQSDAAAATFDTAAAAIGTEGLITFESAPLGSFTNLTVAPGVLVNGTDYGGSPQDILNSTTCTVALCGGNTTVGGSQFLYVNAGTVTFTFSTPTSYWGAYLSGVQLAGETITFNDGSAESVTIPDPGTGGGIEFLGFTDAGQTFTSLTINTPNSNNSAGDFIAVDDVRYETAASTTSTPEPGTLGLGAAGLLLLAGAVRRQRT